jgi:hypothetical protein
MSVADSSGTIASVNSPTENVCDSDFGGASAISNWASNVTVHMYFQMEYQLCSLMDDVLPFDARKS